ncbi:unnamed protein product [Staurois parvus]|uniref:Uncharacterized protein n=1 Tax=Staurois parvus TaxID=386267 RepID=A0ABN9D3K0_9NEOB|nr:unnamed protein product [Staurois parvus]
MDGLIAQVPIYYGTTLEFTELLRATHSFTCMFVETVCMPSCLILYTCGH